MKITAITAQQKDINRVNVFVDGKYSLSLTLNQLLETKIKKGVEIDEAYLKVLQKLSGEGKIYARAQEWLFSRPHSVKEFKDYLVRKKVDPDFAYKLVEDFLRLGYLDDIKFAAWFSEQRFIKGKSRLSVKAELASKGIEKETVEAIIAATGIGVDRESLKKLVKKQKNTSRWQNKDRLIRYLISKGFSYSDIKEELAEDTDE